MKTITVSPETLKEARTALTLRIQFLKYFANSFASESFSDPSFMFEMGQCLGRAERAYDELLRLSVSGGEG